MRTSLLLRSMSAAIAAVSILSVAGLCDSPNTGDGQSPKDDRGEKTPASKTPRPDFRAHERYKKPIMQAVDSIRPKPLIPIPDDPPPHEGAMIDLPYIIEPADLLQVEVLEALPGRPISGERLVRPDGTITLGFYGDVYVRGLTPAQAKAKILLHLRLFLNDEALGLKETAAEAEPGGEHPAVPMPPIPAIPGQGGPVDTKKPSGTQPTPRKPDSLGAGPRYRNAADVQRRLRRFLPRRSLARASFQVEPQAEPPRMPAIIQLPAPGGGRISILITVDPKEQAAQAADRFPQERPLAEEDVRFVDVPPEDSPSVFVDIAAYNSKSYFVQGDFAITGKFPWSGREAVLDAINNAQGFIPTADPTNIRLVRPARGGKPTKIYKVDYKAILEDGDARSNYQLFPGDRLIVGRNDVVKKTIELDRFHAPLQTATQAMSQYAIMMRMISLAAPDLNTAQREAIVKDWIDLWWKASTGPQGAVLDEKTFKEALLRHLGPSSKNRNEPQKKRD